MQRRPSRVPVASLPGDYGQHLPPSVRPAGGLSVLLTRASITAGGHYTPFLLVNHYHHHHHYCCCIITIIIIIFTNIPWILSEKEKQNKHTHTYIQCILTQTDNKMSWRTGDTLQTPLGLLVVASPSSSSPPHHITTFSLPLLAGEESGHNILFKKIKLETLTIINNKLWSIKLSYI